MKQVLSVLYCAIAYFLFANFGLQFSFENTNASPIWPAAGFGMYVGCIHGAVPAIGIILGSLAANYWDFRGDQSPTDDFLISLMIGIGSYLQAIFGAWILHYLGRKHKGRFLCKSPRAILQFFLKMSMSCLVACSVGIGSLIVFRGLPDGITYSAWLMWYVGDLAGAMIFFPLFASLFYVKSLTLTDKAFHLVIAMLCVVPIYYHLMTSVIYSKKCVQYKILGSQIGIIGLSILVLFIVASCVYVRRMTLTTAEKT